MPDQMMRVAGRGVDGKAKAIRTDNSGKLETVTGNRMLIKDYTSTRHTTNVDAFFGEIAGTFSETPSLDVSEYNSISILITNNYPSSINFSIRAYSKGHVGFNGYLDTLYTGRVLSGETVYLTGEEVKKLNMSYPSIIVESLVAEVVAEGNMEVKFFGNNTPVYFEGGRVDVIHERKIRNHVPGALLTPPTWAKSCTVVCKIYGVTGQNASFSFWTRAGFVKDISYSNLSLRLGNNEQITSPKSVYHIWGEGVSYGDLNDTGTDLLLAGVNPQPNVYFEPQVLGSFAVGEGIDVESHVIWKR